MNYKGKRISLSVTYGPTRGRCQVVEYNPNTGQTRSWSECHDHFGNVKRVHPKQINGQELNSQHYPPTWREIQP